MRFIENVHKYYNDNNDEYISVTTLIGKYKNPFDSDYWSFYKACKDHFLSISESKWKSVKVNAGGWDKVVNYVRSKSNMVNYIKANIIPIQNYYLNLWEEEKRIACEKGTLTHNQLEDAVNNEKLIIDHDVEYKVYTSPILENPNFTETRMHTEALVYNHEYKVAGQVDRINQEKKWLHIKDYKTNKEITKVPFMGAKLRVIDLPDANYYHYQMQMSLYGWCLEQYGYKVASLTLQHITNNDNEPIDMVIPYKRDLVIKMLNNYREEKEFA